MSQVDPWEQIAQHPGEFAAWVAGLQRNAAVSAGVDPIYATVSQKYGYFAAYLNHPELGPILRKAAEQAWSAELLQGAIAKTSWWSTHAAAAREFDLLAQTDMATLTQKIHSKAMELQAQAAKMGLRFDNWKSVTDMAERVIKDPTMGEAEIQWMLGSQLHYDKYAAMGGAKGTTSGTMAAAKQRAADYMIDVSDRWAFNMSKNIAMGIRTPDDIEAELRERAINRYAWLAPELEQGRTMRDLFDGHIASIAQLLEVDPETVNLRDPKFRAILETVDDQTGNRRSMTTTEAEEYVRGSAEYDSTKQAMDKAAGFAENVMRTFGKVAV